MGVQLVFVVEANSRCKSDWIYIKESIETFFEYDRAHVRFSPIYMDGKGNYDSKFVQKKIHDAIFQYPGNSHIIYCFDCDEYDSKPEDKAFLDKAIEYCKASDFGFVWFYKDIEQVFHNVRVEKNQKENYATRFKSNKMINNIDVNKLKREKYCVGYSNFANVVGKYLKLKSDKTEN